MESTSTGSAAVFPVLLSLTSAAVGGFLGFWCSVAAARRFSYQQFVRSIARHRVESVIAATNDIVMSDLSDSDVRSRLRDRHRYSLGVIIDELVRSFGTPATGPNEESTWPALVDYNEANLAEPLKDNNGESLDRWSRFNRYVRPVVEDINPFAFLGDSWSWRPRRRRQFTQLGVLADLCKKLELAVSVLDAALEKTPLVDFHLTDVGVIIMPKSLADGDDNKVINLDRAFGDLRQAWSEWLRVSEDI